MNLKVCWLYSNIMDLYGDKGNMMVLEKRCKARNIDIKIDTLSLGEDKDLTNYDLLFLGGGADKEQMIIIEDLMKRKQNILEAIDSGSFVFLICGGYQMFGKYYINANQEKIDCLNIFDYYTDSCDAKDRCTGDIVIQCKLEGKDVLVVGFENHGGQTKNVSSPLGNVLKGHGNENNGKFEGFLNDSVFATYMHGPLLPKNPEVADYVIYKSLKKRNPDIQLDDLQSLDDTLELKAKQTILNRYSINTL